MYDPDNPETETTVAERYGDDLRLIVLAETFRAPAPDGYDAEGEVVYQVGDCVPRDKVSVAEFRELGVDADRGEGVLSLISERVETRHGAQLASCVTAEDTDRVRAAARGESPGFDAEDYATEGEDTADTTRNADGTFGAADGD